MQNKREPKPGRAERRARREAVPQAVRFRRRIRRAGLLLTTMALGIAGRLFYLSQGGGASIAAGETHGSYVVTLGKTRGVIYDTNGKPLVDADSRYVAAVMPGADTAAQYAALAPHVTDTDSLSTKLSGRRPFTVEVDADTIAAEGVIVAKVATRYRDDSVAPHIIGYVNSDGKPVTGIEKALDPELSKGDGEVQAVFAVDALGRPLAGVAPTLRTKGGAGEGGVVLTLDRDIQIFTQQAAQKYLKTGAAVVMDISTGDVLAAASVPTFSQNNVGASVNAENSPLLNRLFSAYDLGSIFKISLCAEALENGISPDMTVNCTGSINISGRVFKCQKTSGHGVQNMEQGLSNSCNPYFITLGRMLGGDKILTMATRLGFGASVELAPGYKPAAGILPTAQELKIPAALANFSIGQGNFMATPVQVARMICAVAGGGVMPSPRLYKGTGDASGHVADAWSSGESKRVFTESIARQIQQFLISTVDVGTGKAAKPKVGGAGGKTGTAQTGWKVDGKTIDQAWFAGFYPADNPRYAIVVLSEAGESGGASAGPVFKDIADHLAPYCGFTTEPPAVSSSSSASSSPKTSSSQAASSKTASSQTSSSKAPSSSGASSSASASHEVSSGLSASGAQE